MKFSSFFESDTGFPRVPEISVSPAIINQEEYSVAELRCSASGSPQPRIVWTRLDGQLSSDVIVRDGYLRFQSLRKSDEGTYLCTAQNNAGDVDQTVQVYVRAERFPPVSEEINVSPSQHSGEPGEEITLRCSSSSHGRAVWSKTGSVELPAHVELHNEDLLIRFSTVDDTGVYVCTVQFPSGVIRTASSDVKVFAKWNEQAPKISTLERKYSVVQGADFELTCEASGTPYPTVTWSIVRLDRTI